MSNKSILILGANSDIGFAIAEKFKAKGYYLLLAARSTAALDKRLKQWADKTGVTVLQFDTLNFNDHQLWFGKLPVVPDITCCVFGYLGNQEKAQIDWKEAQRIIESNYTGAVAILNVVAEVYRKKSSGTIIGISSVAGDRGRQSNYMYGSAKAGFTAYLAGLRNALYRYGVHVLTVKPGFVATKMTEGLPLTKSLTATPERVANSVFRATEVKRNSIYVLPIWYWIMFIIRSVPEFVFKRLKM